MSEELGGTIAKVQKEMTEQGELAMEMLKENEVGGWVGPLGG